MEELNGIWGAIALIVASVSALVARYQETDPNKSWFQRLMKTLDLTQIFDSTRRLGD